MPHYDSALFGKNVFRAECWPPPPSGTWSTKNGEQMRAVMGEYDIARAWVPTPAFNGLVVTPGGQRITEELDGSHELVRTLLPLEGHELLPGEALISAAGGCLFIVALGRGLDGRLRMIAAHAGRDSLIDRDRMLRVYLDQPAYDESPGTRRRPYEGVLYAIVETFLGWGIGADQLEVQGFFSLPAHVFLHPLKHPQYGASNQAMLFGIQGHWGSEAAYEAHDPHDGLCVAVSVRHLFLAQARELHIAEATCHPDIRADGILAHTRHPSPAMREKRNCVIIHRTG